MTYHNTYTYILNPPHKITVVEKIKSPLSYKQLKMNLSEYPENRIGSVVLVVENKWGRYEQRELYRKP